MNNIQGAICALTKYKQGKESDDLALLALVQYWENMSEGYSRNIKSMVSWGILRKCRNHVAHCRYTTVYEQSMELVKPFLPSLIEQTLNHYMGGLL